MSRHSLAVAYLFVTPLFVSGKSSQTGIPDEPWFCEQRELMRDSKSSGPVSGSGGQACFEIALITWAETPLMLASGQLSLHNYQHCACVFWLVFLTDSTICSKIKGTGGHQW